MCNHEKKVGRRYFVETGAKLRRTGTGQTYYVFISGGIHSPAEPSARAGGRLLLFNCVTIVEQERGIGRVFVLVLVLVSVLLPLSTQAANTETAVTSSSHTYVLSHAPKSPRYLPPVWPLRQRTRGLRQV